MARFHSLQVIDVHRDTRDAVVVTIKPSPEASELFTFIPGQYLTFRREFDGEELRRSYSICSGIEDGVLQVGIKRVEGGAFSTWANEELEVGAVLDAMPPMGSFHIPVEPDAAKNYLGFAGGSGITPLLSIIKSRLIQEPKSRFTLVYANQQISSMMFRDELEDLKNTYMGRLSIIHIFDREGQEIDLFTGRIDREKCESLFSSWINLPSIDTAFICGPEPMMLTIADALKEHGLPKEKIKFELFASAQPGRARRQKAAESGSADAAKRTVATVTLDGVSRTFEFAKEGLSLLDAALENDLDAPYACKAGVCSTCKAKVLEGEVDMLINHALEDYEVEQGYVLSCQCYPVSDRVVVSFDE